MKMSKNSSAKYYQDNKEKLQKKLVKDVKDIDGMVVKDTEIYQKMKNKSWLGIEKNLSNEKKSPIIIIRNFFS